MNNVSIILTFIFLTSVLSFAQTVKYTKAIYPTRATNKNPETPIPEVDTLLCVVNQINFMITPNGLLQWGLTYENTIQLKSTGFIENAYLYLVNNQLFIFYTETDMESATSFVERIDIKNKKRIWNSDIYSFNLGVPFIINNCAYLTTTGVVGKLNLDNGKYFYQFKNLYNHKKYSFNDFDTIIFNGNLTIFISRNMNSKRLDSIIVNEKTLKLTVRN